jgi:hypothetical protein
MKLTPKDKAVELINKFTIRTKFLDEFKGWIEHIDIFNSKQFALVAVDEIIDILEINGFTLQEYHDKGTLEYWIHVKEEIENL